VTDENAGYQKAESGKPLALEARAISEDGRRFSPSIGRNRDVVRDAVLEIVAADASVLEIASGTGEHGAHITRAARDMRWTYTDIDPDSMASQSAWRAHEGHNRLDGPFTLNTTARPWAVSGLFDAVFCANMIHIAPFEACEGLIAGSTAVLKPGGQLFLYGPFARNGEIAASNQRFKDDLQRRDPRWGVRDLDQDVLPLAEAAGFRFDRVIEMPANNLMVAFVRV
jgi:SAM-dependent methyltransferase